MKNLKSLATILLFALGTTSLVNAQETKAGNTNKASFGIRGGTNISNFFTDTKHLNTENQLLGFNAGLYAELPLTSCLSFQPEINATSKGTQNNTSTAFSDENTRFRLIYIETPLLLRANITPYFNVHFGPYAAYLVNAKITTDSSSGISSTDEMDEDDLNRFDLGLAAGIGVQFGNFGIGARYNYGLTTVGKEQTVLGQTYTNPDGKNSVIGFYATIGL